MVIFAKYGIGGRSRFDNLQRGYAPSNMNPLGGPGGVIPRPMGNPGAGNMMNRPPPPPGFMPRNPVQGPRGMIGRPPNPMMMGGPRGPMMPRAPMQRPVRP